MGIGNGTHVMHLKQVKPGEGFSMPLLECEPPTRTVGNVVFGSDKLLLLIHALSLSRVMGIVGEPSREVFLKSGSQVVINISVFVGQMVSVTSTELCCFCVKLP